MPAADCRRAGQDRQSLFGKLRTRTRGAEVQRNNGAGGISDIEGKAAKGSGERAGKRASFNGAAAAKGSGVIWGAHAPRVHRSAPSPNGIVMRNATCLLAHRYFRNQGRFALKQKVRDREGAVTSTRGACAPQN